MVRSGSISLRSDGTEWLLRWHRRSADKSSAAASRRPSKIGVEDAAGADLYSLTVSLITKWLSPWDNSNRYSLSMCLACLPFLISYIHVVLSRRKNNL